MTMSRLLNRIVERSWEWRLGINTRAKHVPVHDGPQNDDLGYSPVPFRAFFQAMKHVPSDLLTGTFVDYGAGKGRALVLAARYYKFRRVIGVEMRPELCSQATQNLMYIAAAHAEVICSDAASYQPPSDTTVYFLFNPFCGATMKMVVHNLQTSLLVKPRLAAIVVCNARNFKEATLGQDWYIECAAGRTPPSLNWNVFVTRSAAAHGHLEGKQAGPSAG